MLLAVDLVGFSDLVKLFRVSKTRVEQLVREPDFPPAHRVGTGERTTRVWDLEQVIQWAADRKPPREIYRDEPEQPGDGSAS